MDESVAQGQTARAFMDALASLEQSRDVDGMVAMLADDVTLWRLDGKGTYRGADGAREFWAEYRNLFATISTTFTNAIEGAETTALEWTSQGRLAGGRDVSYAGVTVLDIAGTQVTAVRGYYDSAALLVEDARPEARPGAGSDEPLEEVTAHTGGDSGLLPEQERQPPAVHPPPRR